MRMHLVSDLAPVMDVLKGSFDLWKHVTAEKQLNLLKHAVPDLIQHVHRAP